jgi:CLIP-associating protein 1/2
MNLFINRVDPLYGLGCLRTAVERLGNRGTGGSVNGEAKSKALSLRSIGTLFGKLPAEVLEEEIPKLANLFRNVSPSVSLEP